MRMLGILYLFFSYQKSKLEACQPRKNIGQTDVSKDKIISIANHKKEL